MRAPFADRELLAAPLAAAASASEVYSGIARASGVLWCTRVRADAAANADVAVVLVHPSSNFLGHYALGPFAACGVDAIAMTTRYLGNDSSLLLENCVVDIGAVITHLRETERYQRVVLVGNSGGGGLAALYQQQAEHPTITHSPGGGGPDLTRAKLPPADALLLLMAHPGRAALLTEWLDPAVTDEVAPLRRDPGLDMFNPANGPPYRPSWVARYRAAQTARNERITDWVQQQLAAIGNEADGRVTDLPFTVHGTCADPRFTDLTLDPSDRTPGTLWGEPYGANLQPATLGHFTSLRSWLSQWSLRTSHGDGPRCLADVSCPVLVVYGTADQGCFPSHARQLFGAVTHDRKALIPVPAGHHYLTGQPELATAMAREAIAWLDPALQPDQLH